MIDTNSLLSSFVTPEAGIVMVAIWALMSTVVKPLASYLFNGKRQSSAVKKGLLPGIAVALGMVLALVVAPTSVVGVGPCLVWGLGVGFLATTLWRYILTHALGKVDKSLEKRIAGSIFPPANKDGGEE